MARAAGRAGREPRWDANAVSSTPAVLIIACPCALSSLFVVSNSLRRFGVAREPKAG